MDESSKTSVENSNSYLFANSFPSLLCVLASINLEAISGLAERERGREGAGGESDSGSVRPRHSIMIGNSFVMN